jgi:hypothetical protein
MSPCEICWRRASHEALMLGGSTADRYRQLIAEQQTNPTHTPTTRDDTPAPESDR